jgi:predicted HD phosphohydrolase
MRADVAVRASRHSLNIVSRIQRLFAARGASLAETPSGSPVTALAHALQCAQLADWGELGDPMVAAALLHEIGHLMRGGQGGHEARAAAWLAGSFGPAVVEPVRLHVQAKRYLVAVDPRYEAQLSPGSRRSLKRQGGPMSVEELRRFESLPHALDALSLRRLDDVANQPNRTTPPLAHYLAVLERVRCYTAPGQESASREAAEGAGVGREAHARTLRQKDWQAP